jgi:hypothetical protein
MLVSMRKESIMELWHGLARLAGGDHKIKFAYGIARNREKLRKVVAAITEATAALPEYEKQRIALALELCAKKPDSHDPIILPDGQYVIQDMARFNSELDVIRKETGQDKRDAEVKELMEEEEAIELYVVPFEMLPESIPPVVLQAILPMVAEPMEE